MAGVSAGTVDRILHNRGNVSAASQAAVERVLAETGYRYNIHTSAVSLKRTYKVIIAIPTARKGEYWGNIQSGIEHAMEEYSDVNIEYEYAYYNQFDIFSCRNSFAAIPDMDPSAVIIGATFVSETMILCEKLDQKGIPYIFVDAVIEGTHPAATYSSDQHKCGRIVGRLLNLFTPRDAELAVFGSRRIGNERASNSLARMAGLTEYFQGLNYRRTIKASKISVLEPEESRKDILQFLGIKESRVRFEPLRSERQEFHPGRSAVALVGKETLAVLGELHPSELKKIRRDFLEKLSASIHDDRHYVEEADESESIILPPRYKIEGERTPWNMEGVKIDERTFISFPAADDSRNVRL